MHTFQNISHRRCSGSIKWDKNQDLAPYWIADMDFPSPDCIINALHDRVSHGVFGYSYPSHEISDTLINYMKIRHGATIQAEWIEHIAGCVPALSLIARTFCQPEDAIMTCSPVYPPIRHIHQDAKCGIIEIPHTQENGLYTFDWDAMEAAITPAVKMFILCNPQNPLGRVFTKEEILKLAQFCQKHQLFLCSDEIHCDLILDPSAKHFSAASLPSCYHDKLFIISAPSKTYNIAGIAYSFILIPNPQLKDKLDQTKGHTLSGLNCFSYTAAISAYTQGEEWRQNLISHLRHNYEILKQFVEKNMPQLILAPLQATYLAWIDCSALHLPCPQQFFEENAKVLVNPGEHFGSPQCIRFNFGTSTDYMLEGLEKMARAIRNHLPSA